MVVVGCEANTKTLACIRIVVGNIRPGQHNQATVRKGGSFNKRFVHKMGGNCLYNRGLGCGGLALVAVFFNIDVNTF